MSRPNPPKGKPVEISLEDLRENDYNPRKRFDTAPMKELTDSIGKVGLIQPLAVRKLDGTHEVIVGIRRLKALHNLYDGDYEVSCNLFDVDEDQAQIMSVTENTARQSMTPIEEARAYATYLKFDLAKAIKKVGQDLVQGKPFKVPDFTTREELKKYSEMIGPSRTTIQKRIRLLFLTEHVQNMLENEQITLRTSELLVNLMEVKNPDERTIHMESYAEKYTGGLKRHSEQLEDELKKFLENYKKSTQEIQKKMEEVKKLLSQREKELQKAIDGFKTQIGEDVVTELLKKAKQPENPPIIPPILKNANMLIQIWQTQRTALVKATEFKVLSVRQQDLHAQRDRLLVNVGFLDKNLGIDECPFCGAGINVPNLKGRIKKLGGEIKGIEEEKKELNELQTAVDKSGKTLQSKAKAYETQHKAHETLEKKLKGEEDKDDESE